ncbi:M3 family oligoendopeptidase [Pelobacter propionicus]|uniref:Oligoendopeptidase, pepF/M3 family n=1 Tax=Pelobacter propionicus (strain DSM 2379 / NBRC 103807 / OttBd1) TaxID=338966 RepID=A1ANS8_PELPD|nr:M3 family oligoendopeptidase [Pelobacter propionicus]ABK98998.1 oligoendopeptidase, pepF/M3 family [Pelobacter propionicus DSM 2379]
MTTADLTWNTALLYPAPDSAELEADLGSFDALAADFRERYFEKIAQLQPSSLLEAVREYEALQVRMAKPFCYAHLLFAADSSNETTLSLSQRCSELGSRLSQQLLFFDLELMNLDDAPFQALCSLPQAAPYVHFLNGIRKFRPYTLKENEERLLTRKNLTGVSAFTRLFDELSASLRYSMELDGQVREFTGEELLSLLHHHDPDVRFRAMTTFLEKHGQNGIVFNAVFNNMALDHGQEMELRGYSSPIQPTNIGNEIPDEAVEHLMAVTEANYGLAQEYFRLKAGLLGMEKIRNCDIYAPLAESRKSYEFDEARDLVVASYGAYDAEFGRIVADFFTERRVDVMPRPGKSGGAFAMGISPQTPPFLLLNFTGTLRDLATIAHEAGHGLHFVLSQKQNMLNYHAPLPLAETASVFGEMLLTRRLLDSESDPLLRKSLLCAKIEDIIATTFRQTVLTRFELRLHTERSKGLLTNDRVSRIWLEENEKLFGNAVEMIPAYSWGWSYISHFIHSRFYCYSYTFAELLVLALFQNYCEKGESFKPGYRSLLESGGALSPTETARLAGIDITAGDFWQKGYDFLGGLIQELKAVL